MINIGVVGYGNLGKSVVREVFDLPYIKLVAIFSERANTLKDEFPELPVYPIDKLSEFRGKIDVVLLCHGSKTKLIETAKYCLRFFSTVDAFDNHAKIKDYIDALKKVSEKSGKSAIISVGWDPGLFSVFKQIFSSCLFNGKTYVFWGKGVSQGHSEAVRSVDGVKDAVCYTVPVKKFVKKAEVGKADNNAYSFHRRVCYIARDIKHKKKAIVNSVKNMPDYFSGYKTKIKFVSLKSVLKRKSNLYHRGKVVCVGNTAEGKIQKLKTEFNLKSNPEFTACVMLSYAKALIRLEKENNCGVYTVLDIPPKYISSYGEEETIKKFI